MAIFQHILWGYEITYPDAWRHQTLPAPESSAVEMFQASPEGLDSGYDGPLAGQVAVRAEWNPALEPIEPLWTRAIGLTAGMMGAAKVGSAEWRLQDAGGLQAVGMEAEIILPKRENTRLWTGILARGALVLHFTAVHPKEERKWFEPYATRIISSLRYLPAVDGVVTTAEDLPLPPGYSAIDPRRVIADIPDAQNWLAYSGSSPADALQAFTLREVMARGWQVITYEPFPGPQSGAEDPGGAGFARFQLEKDAQLVTLGIMPIGQPHVNARSPAQIVVKLQGQAG